LQSSLVAVKDLEYAKGQGCWGLVGAQILQCS